MLDKALYSNVPQLNTVEPDIEIEVENPEAMHVGIGGIEIDLDPKEEREDSRPTPAKTVPYAAPHPTGVVSDLP